MLHSFHSRASVHASYLPPQSNSYCQARMQRKEIIVLYTHNLDLIGSRRCKSESRVFLASIAANPAAILPTADRYACRKPDSKARVHYHVPTRKRLLGRQLARYFSACSRLCFIMGPYFCGSQWPPNAFNSPLNTMAT
jgi:hypothetical protein